MTSLTRATPSSSARRATSAFEVSIETGRPESASSTGHDAPQLLVDRDARRPRAGRLAADVDERRALVEDPLRGRHRGRRVEVVAAVREAVGRDVDDTHHGGTRPTLGERGTSHKTMERTCGDEAQRRRPARPRGAASPARRGRGRVDRRRPRRHRQHPPAGRQASSTSLISLYLLLMVVRRRPLVVHPLCPQGRGREAISAKAPSQPLGDVRRRSRSASACSRSSCAGSRWTRACASGSQFGSPTRPTRRTGLTTPQAASGFQPEFATGPVLVVARRSSRSRPRVVPLLPRPPPQARAAVGVAPPALADVLEETLDDLRAEIDPRRAVIAAYARMERALAAFGLPRSPSEAPDEYLQRIFVDLDVSAPRDLALDGAVHMGEVLGTRCGAGDEAGGNRGARGGA